MGELSSALFTELSQPRVTLFGAVRIVMPTGTIRLIDAQAAIGQIGGETYTGRDANWGVLDTIKGLSDTSAASAPSVTIGLIPSGDLSFATMLDPSAQGGSVSVMIGAANQATGAVIDTYSLFTGEVDQVTANWGAHDRRVDIKCTSIAEVLFAIEEGRRLSDAFHKQVWPGELGLAFVTGVEDWVPWGQQIDTNQLRIRTDNPALQYGGTLGSYGGFFGGGFGGGFSHIGRMNLA